jgi:predicted phage terminase large subunit-like protein
VILTSHSGTLAENLSRDARGYYTATGRELDEFAFSVNEWKTNQGGGLHAAGVGGSIYGFGGDLIIIDDPVANDEESLSESAQEKTWNFYQSTLRSRREGQKAVVLMMTRWNERDLAGRILEQEATLPEGWHIVSLEGLKEATPPKIPKSCTLEPDWRETGEALCPAILNTTELKYEQASSEYFFNAMYQQRPTSAGGYIWKRKWFRIMPDEEFDKKVLLDVGFDWDLAYTEEEKNSANAYVKAGLGTDGFIYVDDAGWDWLEFPDLIKWMVSLGDPYYIEKKASGKSAKQMLSNMGLYAREVAVRGGDKRARARIASPVVEQGKVVIRQSIAARILDDERQGLTKFPSGSHDDLSDAFTQMLNRLRSFSVDAPKEETDPERIYLQSLREQVGMKRVAVDWRDAFNV